MSISAKLKETGYSAFGRMLRFPGLGGRIVSFADGLSLTKRPIPCMIRSPAPKFQILIYHRVLPERDPFAISPVSTAEFDRQMGLLRSCFRVVSLDRLTEELDAGKLKPGTVCVTFDDGYLDNRQHALPILKKHGIPATIYLATGFIGTDASPWYDKVLRAVRDAKLERVDFAPAGMAGADLSNPATRAATAYALLEWLKGFAPGPRDAHVLDLARALGSPPAAAGRLMLDWDDVRAMRKDGVVFGAHTVTHPILSTIPESEMDREIGASKAAIESALQEEIRHFAYPNGRAADYTQGTVRILEKHGFKTAMTTETGVNGPGSNRFELLRRQPWETDLNSFHFRMLMERLVA
ncbi:MAG: polysaccharide deacetylase family protein [Fibrobacterota bacterium]|nr:polysaccharide deacetylase family protein [Fibrobacterota bacterium]